MTMMEWVSEEQAQELKLNKSKGKMESCPFCSKSFDSHNGMTAHLRWHSEDIDKMVYEVVARSSKPIRVATIQRLSGANFSVKNAVQRLNRSGKIFRLSEGFSTNITVPARESVKLHNTFELPEVVTRSISEDQMNKLIVANLKRLNPEVYNAVVNEIIENMVRYAIGMAEIS